MLMQSTVRFWLLLAAMVIPATVLIGQQWSLGLRLASLEVYERDTRVRRAVEGFVTDMLEAYRAQNRDLYERLIASIGLMDLSSGLVPPSFESLAEVRAELGRPPMLFIAEPQGETFALWYYGLDEDGNLLPFEERTLEPIHKAVLTYVHGMIGNAAFRERLWKDTFHESSEDWPRAVVHFFHTPLYLDDPVTPRAYAGFWESVDFAYQAFLLPFLQSERLADRLREEGLDPHIFQVAVATTDGTTLYESPLATTVDSILEVRLAAYGELFKPLTLRLGTIRGLARQARLVVYRQNMLLLALAALWFVVAAFMLARSASRDRGVARMHRDFVGRVSHELKTPVAVMLNAVETIGNPKLQSPEDRERCLEMLRSHVGNLSALLAPQRLDLAEHISASLPQLCESVGLASHRIEFKKLGDTVATVDRNALDLILRNLLDNVVKHAGADPESPVAVSCAGDQASVAVSVRDHGVGLPARERKRVFRRFYRIGEGLRMDTPGHGLGLALVKSLVEAHGGRISVDSAVGSGSAFRVEFPREPTS